MSMKKIFVISFLVVILVAVTVVVAAPNNLPGAGWKTGTQVQNVSSGAVNIIMNAYDQTGASFPCDPQTLNSGQSYTYLPENDCATMPAGFQGSAVVSADGEVAAVTNVNNKGTGQAAGQYNGTDASGAATSISFPLVKNNHSGRTTTFYVQNASGSTNNITASFVVNGVTYNQNYNNVPANSMVIINPSDAGVPAGQGNVGSLTVTGTQPLAGSSLEHETAPTVANNLQASRAFSAADNGSTLFCPLVRYQFGGKVTTTGMQVQNVSGGSETINVSYTIVAGPSGAGTVINATSQTVNNGASANFLQADDLQPGDLAAATVTSTGGGDMAAIVNDKATGTSPERVTTYACFNEANATTQVNLPLVKESFNQNTTGVQVQNVGTSPTGLRLTYRSTSGGTVVIETTSDVAPGNSKTFNLLASGGTGGITTTSGSLASLSGTVNGVVAESLDGEPIVAIANESWTSGSSPQDTKNYEGFNQ
jgi:hypothetical protein